MIPEREEALRLLVNVIAVDPLGEKCPVCHAPERSACVAPDRTLRIPPEMHAEIRFEKARATLVLALHALLGGK